FLIELVFLKRGAEVLFDEVAFFLGGEDAGFPDLRGGGVVLGGEAPDGGAGVFVGLGVFDGGIGPGLGVFGAELAPVEHVVVGFHPGGRGPWGGVELELALGGGDGAFDERDAVLHVVFDGEFLEFFIIGGVVVGVDVGGVVAGVDGGAAEGIAVAFD